VTHRLTPIVGNWYSHRARGDIFQVVALDEKSGTIEVQEFDGGLDEIDFDEWREFAVASAAPPDDWGGSVDDVEPDEFGYTDLTEDIRPGSPVETAAFTWEQVVEEDDIDEIQVH
jgi:hypothetical protein